MFTKILGTNNFLIRRRDSRLLGGLRMYKACKLKAGL